MEYLYFLVPHDHKSKLRGSFKILQQFNKETVKTFQANTSILQQPSTTPADTEDNRLPTLTSQNLTNYKSVGHIQSRDFIQVLS